MASKDDVLKQADNMAVLTISGYQLVMPVEDALKTMLNFQKAKKFERSYVPMDKRPNGEPSYIHYIGGALPEVSVAILSSDIYVEGIINGVRKDGNT